MHLIPTPTEVAGSWWPAASTFRRRSPWPVARPGGFALGFSLGLGSRGLGSRGLGSRGLGSRGLGFRVQGFRVFWV